jgi:glycosyltransferase involved in cell wall biosynthesis
MEALDIIVPVYNEDPASVEKTIDALMDVFAHEGLVHIILVDDGSDPAHALTHLKEREGITYLRHETNLGYGAALKTGILSGSAPWIGITDADGTYPLDAFPRLVRDMENGDMVVGVRTGNHINVPWIRRLPKYVLNRFASYFAGRRIDDLNSGLRIFTRELCYSVWALLPSGFSFTSTITMGAIMGGFRIREHPINYFKRTGKSSVRPFRDTIRFFFYACRLGMLFYPLKVFGPASGLLFVLGLLKGLLRDYMISGQIGNLAITIMLTGVQLFMMGLLGELIVHSRNLNSKAPRQ